MATGNDHVRVVSFGNTADPNRIADAILSLATLPRSRVAAMVPVALLFGFFFGGASEIRSPQRHSTATRFADPGRRPVEQAGISAIASGAQRPPSAAC